MTRKRKRRTSKKKKNLSKKMLGILLAFALTVLSGVTIQTTVLGKVAFDGSSSLKKRIEKQSVGIFSLGNGMATCSGVVVGETEIDTMVLTAKHCIAISEEYYVENNSVKYMIASPDDDLALLVVNGKLDNKKSTKFRNSKTELNTIVHHIGYPRGKEYVSTGKITRITKDWAFTDMTVIGGCSGGGVFTEDGELVGIVWGDYPTREKNEPYRTVFEPIEDVKKFMDIISGKIL